MSDFKEWDEWMFLVFDGNRFRYTCSFLENRSPSTCRCRGMKVRISFVCFERLYSKLLVGHGSWWIAVNRFHKEEGGDNWWDSWTWSVEHLWMMRWDSNSDWSKIVKMVSESWNALMYPHYWVIRIWTNEKKVTKGKSGNGWKWCESNTTIIIGNGCWGGIIVNHGKKRE